MDTAKREDVRDVAKKLDEIYRYSPENYFFLKGFIYCLTQGQKNRLEQVKAQNMDYTTKTVI